MSSACEKSFWLERAYPDITPRPSLEGERTFDVIILGAGFTGLSAAYELKRQEPSLRIALLEERVVGYGASGRNAGFAMTLLGENILQLRQAAGIDRAREAHAYVRSCVTSLEEKIRAHAIDCDYERTGLLFIGLNREHSRKLRREVACFQELGTPAQYLDASQVAAQLPATPATGAAYDPHCGLLDPAKLTRALRRIVLDLGVELFENTRVTGYDEGPIVTVRTEAGARARAAKIVLATNAYSSRLGFLPFHVFPLFTYVVLTEPLDERRMTSIGWKGRQGIETARRFVHYLRLTRDNRILIGGGDAYYYRNHGPQHDRRPEVIEHLRRELVTLFPPLDGVAITHHWGGPVACTFDFFPMTGVTGPHANVLYSLGYTGHGVALANSAGRILADLFFERDTPLTRQFFVNRKPQWLPPEPLLTPSIGVYKAALKAADYVDSLW